MKPDIIINVDDQTTYLPIVEVDDISLPDYNILLMGEFPKGPTNTITHFSPDRSGETTRFLRNVADVNYPKYGIGPAIGVEALNNGIGVYVANLRPDDAKMANVSLSVKHKVTADVQKEDDQGNPLYLTPEGAEVTEATDNTPILRDVLELKFVTSTSTAVVDDDSLQTALDANFDATPDGDGYQTTPLVGFRYYGASSFGNKIHFRLIPTKGSDGNVYYRISIYDGISAEALLPEIASLFPTAYLSGKSAYIENVFNGYDNGIKAITSNHVDKFFDDVVADHFNGLNTDPATIDLMAANDYYMTTDATSLDGDISGAFNLLSGDDGTSDLDTSVQALLQGTIVPDIKSILKYKFSYIPDLEYSAAIKTAINTFCVARTYSSYATFMLGQSSFDDAMTDRNTNFAGDYKFIRFIAKAQSPRRYDDIIRRNLKYPASYYDTMALIQHKAVNGDLNKPFAGATARWTDFQNDTMVYPKEDSDYLDAITDARINVVKQDRATGAYLFTQDMGVLLGSDLMELNNCLILGRIVYDLVDLAHGKTYGFNDQSDIEQYNEDIALEVLPTYTKAVSGITANVYKKGLTGEDKSTNIIDIKINFKDISKATEINITITDDELQS